MSDAASGNPVPRHGWQFFLYAAQRHDSAMIEKWKAELDNILVFAGLLSGVLTAYTIESYSWLREDPTATTNRILVLISAQLASFTTAPGLLNSTAPSAAQVAGSFVFEPDSNDVLINTLWFLSLTCSLLASFFAISAQQWIRALPLPNHLPIMHNIWLWGRRHEKLIAWQLPNVIMILPVFLQLAVILFVVGLYYLLRSLSHPITVAFATLSIIPFGLYATFSLPAPFFWPLAPYKSPIVPLLFLLGQWTALPCVFLMTSVTTFIAPILTFVFTNTAGRIYRPASDHSSTWLARMTESVRKLIISTFFTHHDFYLWREIMQLPVRRQDERESYLLEQHARDLGRAPMIVSSSELSLLSSCFNILPCPIRAAVMVDWLAIYFRTNKVNLRHSDRRSPVDEDFLTGITAPFARDYTPFLLNALPREGELPRDARRQEDCIPQPPRTFDWIHHVDDMACILIFLTGIYIERFTNIWPGARDRNDKIAWIPRLMRICRLQVLVEPVPTSDDASIPEPSTQIPTSEADFARPAAVRKVAVTSARYRFPTVCLYGAIAGDTEFEFTSQEISELLRLAEERIAHAALVCNDGRGEIDEIVQVADMVFGSVASSLLALTRQNVFLAPTISANHLLREFTAFIDYETPRHGAPPRRPHLEGIQNAAELARQHDADYRHVIVRRAAVDIVNSLFVLRKRSDIDDDVVGKLVSTLSRLCAENAQELMPRPAFDLPASKLPRVGSSDGVQRGDWKDESEMLFNSADFWKRLQYLKDKTPVPPSPPKSRSLADEDEEPSLDKDASPQDPDDVW